MIPCRLVKEERVFDGIRPVEFEVLLEHARQCRCSEDGAVFGQKTVAEGWPGKEINGDGMGDR